MWRACSGLPKLPKIASLQNLCIISRKKWGMKLIFVADDHFHKLMLSFLMGVDRHVWSTQNIKNAVSSQYFKKELSYEINLLHADKHNSLLQGDGIGFAEFCQTCPNYPGKFAISWWHFLRKKLGMKLDLTALAGSNISLTICYYTSFVLSPLTLFLSQYEIHTKDFLHLINCVTWAHCCFKLR